MNNIKVIGRGIDVSAVMRQLKEHPEDWGAVRNIAGSHNVINEYGFPEVEAGVLQLVMGAVETPDQYVGDSEMCIPTPAFNNHQEVLKIVFGYFDNISRCAFLSLPVGGSVGTHIDLGDYYLTRDRYHLAIQGEYEYTVGDETIRVEPGMLLWFNNKLPHGTKNVGKDVRITFVFDVKHTPYI